MRASLRVLVFVALAALATACASSKTEETPKPALVVDCPPPPVATSKSPLTCAGICLAQEACAETGPTCPAGLLGVHGGCANGGTCCVAQDGGAQDGAPVDGAPVDGAPDSPVDAPPDAPADASQVG